MAKLTSAEAFIEAQPKWQSILQTLRKLILTTELQENIKWGIPTYCIDNKNVVGLGAFKSYAGLWFFNGALLEDKAKVLVNAQEGKTQAMRQWRFTSDNELNEALIVNYLKQAIANQKAGKEIKANRAKALEIPPELSQCFVQHALAQSQFKKMGLSKQREYVEYITSAKREATKQSRLLKIIPMIEQGVGLNDKYR